MRNILIKQNESGGTDITIDGIRLDRLYSFEMEKEPDGPIIIKLSGAVMNEVQVEIL